MPLNLTDIATPDRTALVVVECQNGVIGDESPLPDLAAAARPIVPNIAALIAAARTVGVAVVHCLAVRRRDNVGTGRNAPILARMARSQPKLHEGSTAAAIVDGIEVADGDVILRRLHGLSAFHGTELDAVLRDLGIGTIVATGVSVNVGITNLAFDAVNASYHVVVPRDAVAGFPAEHVESVFAHTLAPVALLTNTAELLELWRG